MNSVATVGTGRTQVSGNFGYGGFQTGMWQLAGDCTTLSTLWLNSDGNTTVPVLPASIVGEGVMALLGSKDAFLAAFTGDALEARHYS